MANTSIFAAFERFWQHVVVALGDKADTIHDHDDKYYTETEIDEMMSGFSGVSGSIEVDKELNDYSTNPVQNKVVNAAINSLNTMIGDTPVSEQISDAITDHDHSASDINSGVLAMENGGTDADNSVDALKNLVAGNTGESLPAAGNAGRMFFLPASEAPFAPAAIVKKRYNISTSTAFTDALNDLWNNTPDDGEGHVVFNVSASDAPLYGGVWTVVAYKINGDYGVVQAIGYNGSAPSILYIRKAVSWGAWEWENPPMVYGTEYRTTERFNGKPVYVKAVRHGALSSGSQTIAHGISNIDEVIGLDVMNSSYGFFSNSSDVRSSADRTNVTINAAWNMGGCIYVIKYTKQ